MQKAPLFYIVILAATATYLSLRSPAALAQDTPPAAPPAAAPAAATTATPTPAASTPTPATSAQPAIPETVVPAITPARPWAHDNSDIPSDPKAIYGNLANGFRYIIYPNSEPPKRVSLRLHIDAGSLMESDNQRGVAHFLEHMVFNGSKHYSADELIPRMQRLGIAFGAHANAYTSFDETVYMLDLPDLSTDTMELAFNVMRDFGDGALLAEKEIDKERGVILSEKISRDTVGTRLMEQQFLTILPQSLISHRFPIGDEKVIQSAPRERFTDFYNRFYTPQRMTFVVVGDIDPASIQKRIKDAFTTMQNPKSPGEDPDLGKIAPPEGIQASVFQDAEVSSTDVSLMLVRPYKVEPDTRATRNKDLPLEIAHSILDRRFERLSKEKNSPVAEGSTSRSNLFNAMELGNISITAADDRWQECVPVIEREFRRVLEFGFTEAELEEAKSNIINTYEQQLKQKATRKSESLATGIARAINDETVFSDPETDLKIVKDALATMDVASCLTAFKTFWDAPGYHLVLTTKKAADSAKTDLIALFEDSRGTAIEAPTTKAAQAFEYTKFGTPGKITSTKEVSDLGITQLVLSNNIRINLKQTDFEKGKIRILARIGSGKLSQPRKMPMLDLFAQAIFEGGGLGKHSNDDLQRILAGKNVSSSLMIGEDAFILGGSTTPADFTTQCQFMCASITDPGFREEALWQFKKAVPMLDQQLKHTAAGPEKEFNAWLHGGDSRFAVASMEKLGSYTIDDVKKWLTPELSKGYIELSIIGDIDIKKITPDLLATFGALTRRVTQAPTLNDAREIKFPNAPASKVFGYDSKIAQAIATTVWKTVPLRGHSREFRRLNVLSNILEDRLREEIREKLGASYSPNAGATGSDALDNMGYLTSESIGKPEDMELLLNTMRDLANQLSTQGATEDEFERAHKPLLTILDKSERDNGYWLKAVLSQCQQDPERLELARTRNQDYRAITLKEINALAKKYLTAENAIAVSIKPN